MGRKKKSTKLKEKPTEHIFKNISASARNLRKTDLGSIIFGCKHSTFKECISKQLFGLPEVHYAYVRNVRPGLPLFLFSYSDRMLHGIFEAQSEGRKNIDPYAWTLESGEATRFPAQVKVRIQQLCQPLTEHQFGPIIAENYYERSHFWFELDKIQTRQIIALFMESTVPRNDCLSLSRTTLDTTRPRGTRTIERGDTSLNTSGSSEGDALVCHVQKELPAKSWSSLFGHAPESKAIIKQVVFSSNLDNDESEVPNNTYPSKLDMDHCSRGENTVHEDQNCEKVANSGDMLGDFSEGSFESCIVSNDDNKAIHSENPSHQSNMEHNEANTLVSLSNLEHNEARALVSLSDGGAVDLSSLMEEFILKMTLSELRTFALKIIHAKGKMESSQSMQDQIIHSSKSTMKRTCGLNSKQDEPTQNDELTLEALSVRVRKLEDLLYTAD